MAGGDDDAGMAESIVASTFRTHRYDLKIVRLTYRGRPLREPLAVLWHKRRPLPRYATAFCQILAELVREVFPITAEPLPGKLAQYATVGDFSQARAVAEGSLPALAPFLLTPSSATKRERVRIVLVVLATFVCSLVA